MAAWRKRDNRRQTRIAISTVVALGIPERDPNRPNHAGVSVCRIVVLNAAEMIVETIARPCDCDRVEDWMMWPARRVQRRGGCGTGSGREQAEQKKCAHGLTLFIAI